MASPYAPAQRTNGSESKARFPPIRPPSQPGAGQHAVPTASAQPQSQPPAESSLEWLSSPRTQRMLQILGVRSSSEDAHPDHTSLSSHSPSNSKAASDDRAPSAEDGPSSDGGFLSSDLESKDLLTTPPRSAQPHQPAPHPSSESQPRMFMLAQGGSSASSRRLARDGSGSRSDRRLASRGGGGNGLTPRRRSYQSVHALRQLDRSMSSPPHAMSQRHLSTQASTPIIPLTPERQLLVDFLTSAACTLFRTPPPPSLFSDLDGPFSESPPEIRLTDAHLDALLSLPSASEDPSFLLRSLRTLERLGVSFNSADELVSLMPHVLARRAALLSSMRGDACAKLFGRSPIVAALNVQAVDRLVEEAGVARLAHATAAMDLTHAQAEPSPSQAYDDALHILSRLVETQHEFHYFADLIVAVREVVDRALVDAGVPAAPPAGPTPPHAAPASRSLVSPRRRVARHATPSLAKHLKQQQQALLLSTPPAVAAAAAAKVGEEKEHHISSPPRGGASKPVSRRVVSSSADALRALVVQRLSEPSSCLVADFARSSQRPDAQRDLDRLVASLALLASPSADNDSDDSSDAPLVLLAHVEASGARFASVAELLDALRSGRIEGPPNLVASPSPTSFAVAAVAARRSHFSSPSSSSASSPALRSRALLQRSTSKREAASSASTTHILGASSDHDPADPVAVAAAANLEDQRRRMAVWQHLATSDLLDPMPSAADLRAAVCAQPVAGDTLAAIRALEATRGSRGGPAPFTSYASLLAYVHDRAIDGGASLRVAVRALLTSDAVGGVLLGTPLSPGPSLDDVADRLVDEGGFATPKHLRALADATTKPLRDIEHLLDAVRTRRARLAAERRVKQGLPPKEEQEVMTHNRVDSMRPSSSLSSSQTDASPLVVQRSLAMHEIVPASASGEEVDLDFDEELVEETEEEEVLVIDEAREPDTARSTYDDGEVATARSISPSPTESPSADDVHSLNLQRRAVWEYVHDPRCRLVPRAHAWTVDEVESLVDIVGPGAGHDSSELLAQLESEDRRLSEGSLPPHATPAHLADELMRQRYDTEVERERERHASEMTQIERMQRAQPESEWWNPHESSEERWMRAMTRMAPSFGDSTPQALEHSFTRIDAPRVLRRLDAFDRLAVARQEDHAREKEEWAGRGFGASGTNGPTEEEVDLEPPTPMSPTIGLLTALVVEPSSIACTTLAPMQTVTVHSHEVDLALLVRLQPAADSAFTIDGTQTAYLAPGGNVHFNVVNKCASSEACAPTKLSLSVKSVLASEPAHFAPDALWQLARHRITQVGLVCDASATYVPPPAPVVPSVPAPRVTLIEEEEPPASVPVVLGADNLDTSAAATRRRAKRMTQAVDMRAVRASGLLRKMTVGPGVSAGDEVASPPPNVSRLLSAPAFFGIHDTDPSEAEPTSGDPLAQSVRPRSDRPSTERSMAEHDLLLAAAKADEATAASIANTPVSLASGRPLDIARLDDDIAQVADAARRKAKRSTQAVDALAAAASLRRTLAQAPAEAVERVSTTLSTTTSRRNTATDTMQEATLVTNNDDDDDVDLNSAAAEHANEGDNVATD